MIELFSRRADAIALSDDAVLTPLPLDHEISSLSAILLDDAYYQFLRKGKTIIDGIPILDAMHLIPFKAKAWLDLRPRKYIDRSTVDPGIFENAHIFFPDLFSPLVRVIISAV